MKKTNRPVTTAAVSRRCPVLANVPIMLAAAIAVALVAVIAGCGFR